MGLFTTVVKQFLTENLVVRKTKISESAYSILIKGDHIKNIEFIPGYFLRLVIGANNENLSRKDTVISYSVWDINHTIGTVELVIATHSKGAGANWIQQIQPGDKVFFRWKKGKFLIDESADSYLMIGDLSALSHMYMIRRNLPEDKQVQSIFYCQQLNDMYVDIDGTTPFDFYEMSQNPIDEIITKIEELVPKLNGSKMVYIAGDSRVCVALNQYFRKKLKFGTTQIKIKPFWNPGKKGLE
ncbi:siderophore-interacting protein [Flexithrix dorotheae]|uniref:siderophore-interacting protein n=1 Tax=Flexithrix dorotheae TaxID=70993 RepID=UPI0003806031|nr:SIP domain-containing protein [Flexithrix dorotheae]